MVRLKAPTKSLIFGYHRYLVNYSCYCRAFAKGFRKDELLAATIRISGKRTCQKQNSQQAGTK
jgi:hypothetical protein